MSEYTASQVVRQHPLWRDFIVKMKATNELNFGAFFKTEAMVEHLGCAAESVEFAFAIAAIRKALRREGKNFTERGQHGLGYLITPPEFNHKEMDRLQASAISALREGVVLGTNTPIELLDAESRRKHEAVLEKIATRLALVTRRTSLKSNNPAKQIL